ncbi:Uncharacterised protein [Salmonella enterica subsp. enterica serovar Bovismorbificans]|uniref:Uncharacterized protein n=1 Tax=Salmonella enterica subsp. enterica serovar Bovismorbificans TaxID=58097 RepID=A0A655BTM2_SALET|nr:Uncharacterised protein [Salmonella enterica subsp. enterica serovar Bovismorbificans]CNU30127.1 Uncharacterised protein [Salmonella enterica subsp. enterica serovar Bovismorbificans]
MLYRLCKNKFVKLIILTHIKLEEERIFPGNVSHLFDGLVAISTQRENRTDLRHAFRRRQLSGGVGQALRRHRCLDYRRFKRNTQ